MVESCSAFPHQRLAVSLRRRGWAPPVLGARPFPRVEELQYLWRLTAGQLRRRSEALLPSDL
jgi:hypothetical protein